MDSIKSQCCSSRCKSTLRNALNDLTEFKASNGIQRCIFQGVSSVVQNACIVLISMSMAWKSQPMNITLSSACTCPEKAVPPLVAAREATLEHQDCSVWARHAATGIHHHNRITIREEMPLQARPLANLADACPLLVEWSRSTRKSPFCTFPCSANSCDAQQI